MLTPEIELLLIRHARPARVTSVDGPADPPLTELGQRQSDALASWLMDEDITAVYTSPMRRALQTAAPLATKLGLEARVEPALQEYDAESRSYVPIEELQAAGDLRAALLPDDPEAFQQGVIAGIEAIISRHDQGKLAIVCHGGVINVYAAWVLKSSRMFFFFPQYTSITRIYAESDGRRWPATLNEAAHLRVAQVPATELSPSA